MLPKIDNWTLLMHGELKRRKGRTEFREKRKGKLRIEKGGIETFFSKKRSEGEPRIGEKNLRKGWFLKFFKTFRFLKVEGSLLMRWAQGDRGTRSRKNFLNKKESPGIEKRCRSLIAR